MAKRIKTMKFRVTAEECDRITASAAQTGLSRSAYIRMVLSKIRPRAAPPLEYYELKKEIHAIGNNINQIALKANSIGFIDVEQFERAVSDYKTFMKRLLEAVELPERIDDGSHKDMGKERRA